MKKNRRITKSDEAYYHITTRIVDKKFRFTTGENIRNCDLMRRVETFSGVQVMAFCFMSNHLHILLRVPKPEAISETELLDRIGVLYGEETRRLTKNKWAGYRKTGFEHVVKEEQEKYLRRMNDIGEFMRTLKERMTLSYNRRHGRDGTLWECSYKSILLEPTEKTLRTVAAYIDLNPVRAKMVTSAEKYRFSSYGEACAGSIKAQAGLCRIHCPQGECPTWEEIRDSYKIRLTLEEMPVAECVTWTKEAAWEALANGADEATLCEMLRAKCNVFSTGMALGCEEFIQQIKQAIKDGTLPSEKCFVQLE